MTSVRYEPVIALLKQLSKYTKQLSRSEEDPEVDVPALTHACQVRMAELEEAFASVRAGVVNGATAGRGAPSNDFRSIIDRMKALEDETQECMIVLNRCRERAERELASMSQTRKAIRAYGRKT